MPTNTSEIVLPLCHEVAICQILFGCTFDEIERKTGIKANSTGKPIKHVIE